MPYRSPSPRPAGPHPSTSPAPRPRRRPAGRSPVRLKPSPPHPLLVSAVPYLGDAARNHAEYLHAPDCGLSAVLQGHRGLIHDRDMLPVVAGDDKVQVEPELVEHLPVVRDTLDALFMRERLCLTDLVPDDRLSDQLVGEGEIALVPDDKVVQLDYFASSSCHGKAFSASMSSMVATARSTSVRHSARERSGILSHPTNVMTGKSNRYATANR